MGVLEALQIAQRPVRRAPFLRRSVAHRQRPHRHPEAAGLEHDLQYFHASAAVEAVVGRQGLAARPVLLEKARYFIQGRLVGGRGTTPAPYLRPALPDGDLAVLADQAAELPGLCRLYAGEYARRDDVVNAPHFTAYRVGSEMTRNGERLLELGNRARLLLPRGKRTRWC